MNIFKIRLKEALDNKNWKQADLMRATGISKSMISDYMNGNFEPKEENLVLLSNSLNVSKEWLSGLNEEYILNNTAPDALANMLTELLVSETSTKNISYQKLADMSKLDLDSTVALLNKKYKYVDYKYLRLVLALELQENSLVRKVYYNSLPSSDEYISIVGSVYKKIRQNSDRKIGTSSTFTQELADCVEENPFSLDLSRVDNYAMYLGVNLRRDSIENMIHYYYFLQDYFSMGLSTLPLEDLNLYLISKENITIDQYIDICVNRIQDITRKNKIFDFFAEEIFEIADKLSYQEQELFFQEIIKFAKYTAKKE